MMMEVMIHWARKARRSAEKGRIFIFQLDIKIYTPPQNHGGAMFYVFITVCLSVGEQNFSQTDVTVLMRFKLN